MSKLYSLYTCLMQADSEITHVEMMDDGNSAFCVRDVLFYPGGAGQPKETSGKVILRGQPYPIEDVIKFKGDILIKLTQRLPFHTELKKGEYVCQCLDISRRLKAARYHSLQHAYGAATRITLCDYQSRSMEIAPDLTSCTMRFVTEQTVSTGMLEEIQGLVANAVEDDLPITVRSFASVEEVQKRYGKVLRLDSTLPPFKGNNLRTVIIGEPGGYFHDVSLCAGTHIHSLLEAGTFTIEGCGVDQSTGESFLTFAIPSREP